MNQPYRWCCYACDKPNEPSAASCASCGFPAMASGSEIARARASRGLGGSFTPLPIGSPSPSLADLLAGWSGWRIGVAILGVVLVAIGAYAWNAMTSWRGLGVSVLALLFGVVVFLVAWTGTATAKGAGQPAGG